MPGVSGHTLCFDATTRPLICVTLWSAGAPLRWNLWLRPVSSEVHVFAQGESGEPDGQSLQSVKDVLASIADGMGAQTSYSWQAVIGEPAERVGGMEFELAAAFDVGGLHVESSGVEMAEPSTHRGSLSSFSENKSVPLVVSGLSTGATWDAASREGARQLHHLCGLLSVVWETPVVVREYMRPGESGSATVLSRVGWFREIPGMPHIEPTRQRVSAPDGLQARWDALQRSRSISQALDVYSEGVSIQEQHPSLAAVAFTACVEALVATVESLPRCPHCNVVTGSTQRFRRGLRLVLNEAEAQELDSIYNRRSRTVHDGRLHGDEVLPGFARFPAWAERGQEEFRVRTVEQLRRAARSLLILALDARLVDGE
jgi:hypothetical protein